MKAKHFHSGFSLVEVVFAIGVISFALLSIVFLFSTSLQSNSNMVAQVEAVGMTDAVSRFLERQGFSTVYGWVRDPSSMPEIYAYGVPANGAAKGTYGPTQLIIRISGDPLLASEAATREGRLFRVYLSLSPNMPFSSVARPVASDLPSQISNYSSAFLAVQAQVYEVTKLAANPVSNLAPQGAFPSLTYDIALAR